MRPPEFFFGGGMILHEFSEEIPLKLAYQKT